MRQNRSKRRRALRWSLGIGGVVLVALAVVAAMIIPKALQARDSLEAAVPTVAEIQKQILAGDSVKAQELAAGFADTAEQASGDTDGFLWRALEPIPFVGPNLHAVRMATATVSEIAQHAVLPAASLSPAMLTPVEGRIDPAAIDALVGTVREISVSVAEAESMMSSVQRSALVGPVSSGVQRIDDALQQVSGVLKPAAPLVEALPGILGQQGARDVLVIFQNNAEVMPGGGTIGSLAQLHIEDGAVAVVAQSSASGRDMAQYSEPVVPVAADALDLYPFGLGTHVQHLTKTPRFDLTFEIAREMWRLKTGVTVDAVVALDTVALSYLLVATGPIPVSADLSISNDNAVALLLGDLYYRYEPAEVDLINQAFAGLTMQALMSGKADPAKLVSVLGLAAEEGRIRIWSAREQEQELIAGSAVDKRGPVQTEASEGVGVYFVDYTPGKMQRYMTQAVDIGQSECRPGERQVRVSVTLANTVDPAVVSRLPEYVTGVVSKKGSMQVDTLVYAPAGYALVATGDDQARTGTDGEFSVSAVRAVLAPGESRTFVFEYTAEGPEKSVTADVTPVVTPTQLTQTPLPCS